MALKVAVNSGSDCVKLTDLVVHDAIITDLVATTKTKAIHEIIDSLATAGCLAAGHAQSVVSATLDREQRGSTGIGKGVAIPHASHPSVDRVLGTVAVSKSGLDFASLDREPVYVIILLISPPRRADDFLQALECISRHLRADRFCRMLHQAKSKDAIAEILNEADEDPFL